MTILVLLAVQEVLERPEQGVRFAVPSGWTLRTQRLRFGPHSYCEFESPDEEVKGLVALHTGRPKSHLEFRVAHWKKSGAENVEVREAALRLNPGTAILHLDLYTPDGNHRTLGFLPALPSYEETREHVVRTPEEIL